MNPKTERFLMAVLLTSWTYFLLRIVWHFYVHSDQWSRL